MINLISESEMKIYQSRICCICKSYDTLIYNGYESWHKCNCEKNDCSKWICKICYSRNQHRKPSGYLTKINSMSKHKNDLLKFNSETGKGLIDEAIVAKVRNLDIVSIKSDNFRSLNDLSKDMEYGIIEVKLSTKNKDGNWQIYIHNIDQDFDYLFVLCTDEQMDNIVRVYIIPIDEIVGIRNLSFRKSLKSKWEKFAIDIKLYNAAFKDLMNLLKKKDTFGISNIIDWYNTYK